MKPSTEVAMVPVPHCGPLARMTTVLEAEIESCVDADAAGLRAKAVPFDAPLSRTARPADFGVLSIVAALIVELAEDSAVKINEDTPRAAVTIAARVACVHRMRTILHVINDLLEMQK